MGLRSKLKRKLREQEELEWRLEKVTPDSIVIDEKDRQGGLQDRPGEAGTSGSGG